MKGKKIARSLLVVGAVILGIWVLLSPRVSQFLYTSKLFHPNVWRGSDSALKNFSMVPNQQMDFRTTDGSKLRGWYFESTSSENVFLLHQGNSGDIASHLQLIELLLQTGYSVFVYEPRGFGESEGKPSIRAIREDGIAAYDYLRNQLGYKANQIVIYGVSLGSAVATHVVTNKPAKGVVLQSGFASLGMVARERIGWLRIYPNFMFPAGALNNARLMRRQHPPLLLLHGGQDTLIPVHHSLTIYHKATSPKYFSLLPNSGHHVLSEQDSAAFVGEIHAFLETL